MLRVLVDNRVRILESAIATGLADALRAAFTRKNPKREQLKKAKVRGWWNEPEVFATWGGDDRGNLTFPRGGMARVRELLREHLVEFRVADGRRKMKADVDVSPTKKELREYQERLVSACLERENCLVRSGTGSGKTTALLALFARIRVPTLVIVHQVALAEQWIERAVEELGMDPRDVGILGGGQKRIAPLTIGVTKTISNVAKANPGFLELWGAVLVDEVHLFAAKSLFACVDQFPARYRIGASDDERRKDRLEFLIYDLFGPPAAEVSDEELVQGGHVMDVEVLLVPTEFRAEWYASGDDEEKKPDFGLLVQEMAADADRQAIIDRLVATELADGRQIIAFAKEREHCHAIGTEAAKRSPTGYLIGGRDYRDEYKRTKQGMRAGKIRVAVGTYQACGASLDIPSVEVGIAASPCLANRTTFRQGRGRICRKPFGKTVARFYVLWDRHVFGLRHVENAARWNPSTFVWDAEKWVPAREFLKGERIAAKEAKDGEAQDR